jgi:hypothetical protein
LIGAGAAALVIWAVLALRGNRKEGGVPPGPGAPPPAPRPPAPPTA